MSVATFWAFACALAAGKAPVILAASACALADSSFNSGSSCSICLRLSPSSFFIIFVERHLGKLEHPRNGPRLLSRRSIGLPHFSQATVVLIGGALGGSGRPSWSRLMIVLQTGSPCSSFSEYPLHPSDCPKRPLRLIIGRSHLGQLNSLSSLSVVRPCLATGRVAPHDSRLVQARNSVPLLMR